MKKLSIILGLLFLTIGLFAYSKDGEYRHYWPNGQLAVHSYLVNGQYYGEFKAWNSDGFLYIHCWYKEGKLDGEYTAWYDNGKIEKHIWYDMGKKVRHIEDRRITNIERGE